jgi:hypothetical protein
MKNRTLAIWPQTHKIFRLLAAESGRPIIVLLQEAAELLRAAHAAKASDSAEVPQHRSIDTGKSRTDYPTAA